MTQIEVLLKHLQTIGSITQMEALHIYGIMRLAARISELKKLGFPIERTMETMRNRYGDAVTFARYRLRG